MYTESSGDCQAGEANEETKASNSGVPEGPLRSKSYNPKILWDSPSLLPLNIINTILSPGFQTKITFSQQLR